MRYKVGRTFSLGSSSLGNSFYMEIFRKDYPNPFRLLIECGFTYSEVSRRLLDKSISVSDLDAVLVTHEHFDHSQAVRELIKRGVQVYAPKTVFEKHEFKDNEIKKEWVITEMVGKIIADGIKVYGFPLEHENDDGTLTYNLGYIINVDNDFNILFVTDTKRIRWNLSKKQFNVIFIEANYQRKTLYFALKNAKEKRDRPMEIHYNRVLKSHFCVENTADTLSTFDLRKTDIIYLIHMSANTQINPFEFKKIIYDKIRHKMRKETFLKHGKSQTVSKPKIIAVKKNGEMI